MARLWSIVLATIVAALIVGAIVNACHPPSLIDVSVLW